MEQPTTKKEKSTILLSERVAVNWTRIRKLADSLTGARMNDGITDRYLKWVEDELQEVSESMLGIMYEMKKEEEKLGEIN